MDSERVAGDDLPVHIHAAEQVRENDGYITNRYNAETPLTTLEIQSDQIITPLGTSCVTQSALDGTYVPPRIHRTFPH